MLIVDRFVDIFPKPRGDATKETIIHSAPPQLHSAALGQGIRLAERPQ
jgi:hypothetical protein